MPFATHRRPFLVLKLIDFLPILPHFQPTFSNLAHMVCFMLPTFNQAVTLSWIFEVDFKLQRSTHGVFCVTHL